MRKLFENAHPSCKAAAMTIGSCALHQTSEKANTDSAESMEHSDDDTMPDAEQLVAMYTSN